MALGLDLSRRRLGDAAAQNDEQEAEGEVFGRMAHAIREETRPASTDRNRWARYVALPRDARSDGSAVTGPFLRQRRTIAH